MSSFSKLWWWLFRISFPLTLISYPIIAVFGSYSVWPPAQQALSAFPNDVPILIGFSDKTTYSTSGSRIVASRTYMLFPSVIHSYAAITVQKTNELEPVVTESVTPVIFAVVYYVISMFGTWWFWLRSRATQQNAPVESRKKRD